MKKIIAVLLTGLLIMSLTTTGCSAAGDAWKNNTGEINLDSMTVSGQGVSVEKNTVKITEGGDFVVKGTLADGMIYVNAESKAKLRLNGVNITNTTGPAIFFENSEKGFITLTENTENILTDGKEYTTEEANAALFSNDDLEIKGEGKLTVNANFKHGIASDDDLVIENGVIAVNAYEHGIKVNDTLAVSGGSLTVVSETGKGIKAELEVSISGGVLDITSKTDEGIESKGVLNISGGDIRVTAGEDGLNSGSSSSTETAENIAEATGNTPPEMPQGERPEMPQNGEGEARPGGRRPGGMRGQNGEMPEGERPEMPEGERPERTQGEMPQGEMPERPQGGGFGGFSEVDEETAKAHAITISGGKLYINAAGDGIDSNGNLTISGGEVIIDGPIAQDNGALDASGTMSITNAKVVIVSSAGMMQLPRDDAQNTVRVMFDETQAEGTVLSLREKSSGREVAGHTSAKEFRMFIVSAAEIKADTEYVLYVNGAEYKTFTVQKGMTNVGNQRQSGKKI